MPSVPVVHAEPAGAWPPRKTDAETAAKALKVRRSASPRFQELACLPLQQVCLFVCLRSEAESMRVQLLQHRDVRLQRTPTLAEAVTSVTL